jgi:hypothetical protein
MKYCFIFFIVVCSISCKKDKNRDKTLPVVVIDNLIENQRFNIGDTITIQGNVMDINKLEECRILITSKFDDNEFIHLHYGLLNATTWSFNVKHKVTHTNNTSYTIAVEAKDEDGNFTSKAVSVKIN